MPDKTVKQPIKNGVARVPVVMQLEALECGAACLCMLLAYYDKWIPLEQVRSDCGVSRDGSNARNILAAARNYGLEAAGYRMEPEDLRNEGTFPCIIHWEFNHFVVCRGFKGDRVYLNDPARGDYSITVDKFDESFTGICLMFTPGSDFVPGGRKKSVLSFTAKRLKGAGAAIFFTALTTMIASMTGIIEAGFTRAFLDILLPGRNSQWIVPFFVGLFMLTLIKLVADFILAVYSLRIDGKLAAVGNASYMWKVLKLPMEFYSQRMAGDIQSRKDTNASIAGEIVNTIAPLIFNAVMLVFYLVVMVRYSPLLSVIGLSALFINLLLSRYISAKRINITRIALRDQGKLTGATMGAMDMIETIKASGAENGYFERWAGYQASVNTQAVKFTRLDQYLGMLPSIVSSIINTIILIMGVYITIQGHFTAGMVLAFQGFLTSFMEPVNTFITAGQNIQEMRTDMERIEDVMEYRDDPVFDGSRVIQDETGYDKLSGSLVLKDVTFGYSRLSDPLIENFSLNLERGHSVAFVGSSGCGKSTLAKLISGLYEPWSGEILYDGKPINTIDRSIFTGSVAVVDQDITLFEDTIANNIKMWDNSIEDFEMILAARDASLHEDIMQRDGGYNYKLSEGGRDFSGGQRQRLEIARVLAQDPTMIILDEATSALDARTEYEVIKSIKTRGITCIIIAHRLSTIRDCDEIIVMDKGKVVERGTHNELIARHGMYEQLITNE
ncbi:MAG: NHLP family bacteriocin export ABC transporter peptidase/permease/ATPase subunit [Lachnospiraceae bacterium]|nr:NHLP family bacteriocin export ABC transporter peptidase/permease/ATPase subunit [Lachnospiraceae bacterium]